MVARDRRKGKPERHRVRVIRHEPKSEDRPQGTAFPPGPDPGSADPVPPQGTRGCPSENACETRARAAVTVTVPVTALCARAAAIGQRQVNLPFEKPATPTSPAAEQVTVAAVGAEPSLHLTWPTTVARLESRLSRKSAIVRTSALERPVASSSAAAASRTP